MWVVKLGGSLAHSPELGRWVAQLAEWGPGRAVVVPGGGVFADVVRGMQDRWAFSDDIAHRMAVLAMEQFGWMLSGLASAFLPAASHADLGDALEGGRVPVWLPAEMIARRRDIPASWSITSDSLAAWLALDLRAENLLLVKSVAPLAREVSVEELSRQGIVDPVLPGFLARAGFECWWEGMAGHTRVHRILHDRELPAARVVCAEALQPAQTL